MKNEKYAHSLKNGQAALISIIFFLTISTAILVGFSSVAIQENKISKINFDAKRSLFLTEAGQEDALYRVMTGKIFSTEEVVTLGGFYATTSITTVGQNREITASSTFDNAVRSVKTVISGSTPAGFGYAGQIGNGGLHMENTSSIAGDVYSNGPITGNNSPVITGDATSGSTIGDPPAVVGARTEFAPPIAMPIADATLDEWGAGAAAGGTYAGACPYEPQNGATIGPIKVPCDLIINGTKQITIAGPVWVAGDIDFKNSAIIRLALSYGGGSEVIIAHDENNPSGKGAITVQNTATVLGSGSLGSTIMMISRNNSAETGGDVTAIDVKNSSTAAVYYAPHGKILAQNSSTDVHLKALAAYRVELKNRSTIVYDTNLSSATVSSGTQGITTWQEVE